MTDKFPLFRLPYLALHKILNHVGPEVTLSLSFCSKRSKLLVKHCQGPRKDINITLYMPGKVLRVNYASSVTDFSISVVAASEQPANLKTANIGSHVVPVEMERNVLKTYWTEAKEGFEEIVKYTSDVFSRDLYSIAYRGTSSLDDNDVRHWLEWIKARQGKLCRLNLTSTKANDNLLMYILESDIVTGNLILDSVCSTAFRGPSPRPFSIDYLYLWQSKWVTLNHLLAMDIKQIILSNTSLPCQEINIFPKKWINGECSKRIKLLHVGMGNEMNYDVLMVGIKFNRRDPSLRRVYAMSPNLVEPINGGFDIRRKEDGALATIISGYGGLQIRFWPDYKGNPYH